MWEDLEEQFCCYFTVTLDVWHQYKSIFSQMLPAMMVFRQVHWLQNTVFTIYAYFDRMKQSLFNIDAIFIKWENRTKIGDRSFFFSNKSEKHCPWKIIPSLLVECHSNPAVEFQRIRFRSTLWNEPGFFLLLFYMLDKTRESIPLLSVWVARQNQDHCLSKGVCTNWDHPFDL